MNALTVYRESKHLKRLAVADAFFLRAALLRTICRWAALSVVCAAFTSVHAQVFNERFSDWPLHTSMRGSVYVSRSDDFSTVLSHALPAPGQRQQVLLVIDESVFKQEREDCIQSLKDFSVTEVNTSDAEVVVENLHGNDVICWFSNSPPEQIRNRQPDQTAKEFAQFLHEGGVAVISGNHWKISGTSFETGVKEPFCVTRGLGLLPDCHLIEALTIDSGTKAQAGPRMVTVGLSASGILSLSGRKMRMLAAGETHFHVAGCDWLPVRHQTLYVQQHPEQDPNEYLVDLTEWRREAIERTLETFPGVHREIPHLENGTLVIVGGGRMPEGLMEQFVNFAGGPEKAELVYVPCSERPSVSQRSAVVSEWKRLGVKTAAVLHTKDRLQAHSDNAFLKPLRSATGIWFGGGRQWNLADSYYGTTAHQLMKEVLHRGGVVGGSSAGASIQARYLARATPIQNLLIMAPGYERGGLGFIGGVAIDQHFSQRSRQKDLIGLVDRYPQLLGIGIDEATALLVQNSVGTVVGDGDVYLYDHSDRLQPNDAKLTAGESYDLAGRFVVKPAPE